MSVTAVPLRPITKGSVTRVWIGVAAIALSAAGLAWVGQRNVVASPSAFMVQNAREAGVVTTESGLQYKVLQPGQGPSPTQGDVTLISYRGTLVDGTVFDQSEQTAMPVEGVVPGFSEALKLMKRGGEYKLFIPPELAYGKDVPAGGPIPSDAVLIFDVKLIDFKSRAEIMQMQQQMRQMPHMESEPGQ